MKTKILEALTTKFEGVNSKILDGIAEKLSKTVTTEEEVATAVAGVTFQQVLDSYGDSRATNASMTAVKNYESKHGLKDGKPLNPPTPTPTPTPSPTPTPMPTPTPAPAPAPAPAPTPASSMSDEVKALFEEMRADRERMSKTISSLQGEINGMKATKLAENRKSVLEKEISKLSVAQQNPYKRIDLNGMTDEEFNTFIGEVKSDVSAIEKDKAAAAAAVGRPFTGGIVPSNGKASAEEVQEVAKFMR